MRSLPNGYRADFRRLADEGNPTRASDYLELLSMQKSSRERDEFSDHAVAVSLSRSLTSLHGRQGPKIRTREPRRVQLPREAEPQAAVPHTPCWSQREAADGVLEDISDVGINPVVVFHNTTVPELTEHALAYEPAAHVTARGALAVLSGEKTGLSLADRRLVRDAAPAPGADAAFWGRGSPNVAMSAREFEINRERAVDFLNTLPRLYVTDGFLLASGAQGEAGDQVRVVTGRPSHALFARQFLQRPRGDGDEALAAFGEPDFTLYDAGDFPANRAAAFASSSTLCTLSFQHREAVVLGTQYLGELRDVLLTYLNGRLTERGALCLRAACSAGAGAGGATTLFLGLPGTGKSTLAAHGPRLVAQDGAAGLRPAREPAVHAAAVGFGAVLENVTFDAETREVDFEDTAAIYYFLSGYTTRVARHPETGAPETHAAFSPCFWASPLLGHPCRYALALRERLRAHRPRLWMMNTGYAGGGVASGGRRIPLQTSRTIVEAIQSGRLGAEGAEDDALLPLLGLRVPTRIPGVDDAWLRPRELWTDGQAYDAELRRLASLFVRNAERYADGGGFLSPEDVIALREAGPDPYAR
ncbi:hypothetical protein QBZ16_003507 [Prototheca wickerhamii]|uniref:phosphoenolpyruvate carboxykinase (ATP) n=1 Tax=Prototheca wickerhamii TaxID=3111 RepID=A0AAD9ILZ6_PROWI|nr:hypothetical protein QBZ16_003507 [Prototheca wickerhamii]